MAEVLQFLSLLGLIYLYLAHHFPIFADIVMFQFIFKLREHMLLHVGVLTEHLGALQLGPLPDVAKLLLLLALLQHLKLFLSDLVFLTQLRLGNCLRTHLVGPAHLDNLLGSFARLLYLLEKPRLLRV